MPSVIRCKCQDIANMVRERDMHRDLCHCTHVFN